MQNMEAFPYPDPISYALDYPSFPAGFTFDLLTPPAQQQSENLAGTTSGSRCYDPLLYATNDSIVPVDTSAIDAAFSFGTTTTPPAPDSNCSPGWNDRTVPLADRKKSTGEQRLLQKKRIAGQRLSSESPQQSNMRTKADASDFEHASKSKKLRRRCAAVHEKPDAGGYIQVRARRGEATDSHSLAERVRREKIRKKMKVLQDLVPGCEKVNKDACDYDWAVVGKALMLEEIINYVQSLKSQVEFLSMKLASMEPILYSFSLDCDDYAKLPEELESLTAAVPSVGRTSHIGPTDAAGIYPFEDSSTKFLCRWQPDLGASHQVHRCY